MREVKFCCRKVNPVCVCSCGKCSVQASEEQNQKGFSGHQVQCSERIAAVLLRLNSPTALFCPRLCFQVSVMSQFLTDQRIAQLLDTKVVLGAVDGESQALFFF